MADLYPTQGTGYRGRLAPSPTGYLHIGHACTFWTAYQRALLHDGALVLRNEDLDPQRSKPELAKAMIEDLAWLGIRWQEAPTSADHLRPMNKAAGGNCISKPGASCATKDSSIPVPVRERIWRRQLQLPTMSMMSLSIRDTVAAKSARPETTLFQRVQIGDFLFLMVSRSHLTICDKAGKASSGARTSATSLYGGGTMFLPTNLP